MPFFLTMAFLATFAAVFLEDFTILGNSPQHWEEGCGRSFRQKCIWKEKYSGQSGSSGMKVQAPKVQLPRNSSHVFHYRVCWPSDQSAKVFTKTHENSMRTKQRKCCQVKPNSFKTTDRKVFQSVLVGSDGPQMLDLTLRIIFMAVTDLQLQLPFL